MYLDPSFIYKFKKPGAMHHARFMDKGIYYMKTLLLKDFVQNHIDLDSALITRMGKFIAIFYAPKFLTNEKPDIAPLQVFKQSTSIKFKYKFTITKFHALTVNLKNYKNISFFLYQDLNSVWKMSRYVEDEPAASAVFKSWGNHSWYLDQLLFQLCWQIQTIQLLNKKRRGSPKSSITYPYQMIMTWIDITIKVSCLK